MKNELMQSELLPESARELLQRAAKTPIPDGQPLARTRALETAIGLIRHKYPQFFQPVKE